MPREDVISGVVSCFLCRGVGPSYDIGKFPERVPVFLDYSAAVGFDSPFYSCCAFFLFVGTPRHVRHPSPNTRYLPRAVCYYSPSRSRTSHFPSVPSSPSTQSLVRWPVRITKYTNITTTAYPQPHSPRSVTHLRALRRTKAWHLGSPSPRLISPAQNHESLASRKQCRERGVPQTTARSANGGEDPGTLRCIRTVSQSAECLGFRGSRMSAILAVCDILAPQLSAVQISEILSV